MEGLVAPLLQALLGCVELQRLVNKEEPKQRARLEAAVAGVVSFDFSGRDQDRSARESDGSASSDG